jgi:hypothetical protein
VQAPVAARQVPVLVQQVPVLALVAVLLVKVQRVRAGARWLEQVPVMVQRA